MSKIWAIHYYNSIEVLDIVREGHPKGHGDAKLKNTRHPTSPRNWERIAHWQLYTEKQQRIHLGTCQGDINIYID
jgi:hypothetical protein